MLLVVASTHVVFFYFFHRCIKVLAEFEMAHVWLFFVGIMYIINAVVFTITLDSVKHEWDKCDAMRTVDVQRVFLGLGDIDDNGEDNVVRKKPSDWTWPTIQRRGSCCYQIFGSGTGPSSWAEFKTLKLYFIQQVRRTQRSSILYIHTAGHWYVSNHSCFCFLLFFDSLFSRFVIGSITIF